MDKSEKFKVENGSSNSYGRLVPLRLNFNHDTNTLKIDALTLTSVTSRVGYERQCLTRSDIEIPWNPSIFLAIREGDANALRKEINLSLALRDLKNFVTFRPYGRVNMLIREMDHTYWYINENSRLYEIKCHDTYTKRIVENFLTDNASSRANEYCLFAVKRDVAFNVAIATALRFESVENIQDEIDCSSSDDDDDDADDSTNNYDDRDDIHHHHHHHVDGNDADVVVVKVNDRSDVISEQNGKIIEEVKIDDDVETNTSNQRQHRQRQSCKTRTVGNDKIIYSASSSSITTTTTTTTTITTTKTTTATNVYRIDLSQYFEFCEWCYYDTEKGNFLKKMLPRDLELNGLTNNPIGDCKLLPIVVYDIETIASNENILPRGVEEDQRLSSFAISIHMRDKDNATTTTTNTNFIGLILAYVPIDDPTKLKEIEATYRKKFSATYINVYFYRKELDLLNRVVDMMSHNEYLLDLFQTTDYGTVDKIASILQGYNVWDYDFPFILDRLIFYGEYERAIKLAAFLNEPRFNRAQISFDLIKHVIARHRAITGSVALSHVAKFFGAAKMSENSMTSMQRYEKMKFDAVAIRRLYFDTKTGTERFDEHSAFEENCDINLEKIFRYNIQDCATVYYLMLNLNFLDIVISYSKHFFTPLIDCSYVGNSRLLPNAIAVQALRIANTVIPYRDNKIAAVMINPYGERNFFDIEKTNSSITKIRDKNRGQNVSSTTYPISSSSTSLNGVRELKYYENFRYGRIDELEIMRINDDKMYIGGINSAISGHYPYTLNVDFASFYPSIGCTYGLSMETVKIMTVGHLIFAFDGDESIIDRMIFLGTLRVFDYEPPLSTNLKIEKDSIRGKDDLARRILRRVHWYEGVEFSNVAEMKSTSRFISKRRVLMVKLPDFRYKPIVKTLWEYYLTKRKEMKLKLKSLRADQVGERNVFVCLEKMYKVISNCMYGDQNYIKSSTYSPPVAAAICLLSRKTFHETTWIAENEVAERLSHLLFSRNADTRKDDDEDLTGLESILITSRKRNAPNLENDVDAFATVSVSANKRSRYKQKESLITSVTSTVKYNGYDNGTDNDDDDDDDDNDDDNCNKTLEPSSSSSSSSSVPLSTTKAAAAAAATTFSSSTPQFRKTYQEKNNSLQKVVIKTIYSDTDGAIFSSNVRIRDEESVVRFINSRLKRSIEESKGLLTRSAVFDDTYGSDDRTIDVGKIFLELESSESPLCTIMGKKKYWRIEKDRSIVTKGFEKNAQSFVKELVNTLQRNVLTFVETIVAKKDAEFFVEKVGRTPLLPQSPPPPPPPPPPPLSSSSNNDHEDSLLRRRSFFLELINPVEFYVEVFRFLHRYYVDHGEKDFTFNILLNPLEFDTPKACFVEETLALCDYDIGDRVKCLYRLNPKDPFETELCLIKNFDSKVDRINYYKSIRSLAAYFLQLVEGDKTSTEKNFDRVLRDAYSIWLSLTSREVKTSHTATSRSDIVEEEIIPQSDSLLKSCAQPNSRETNENVNSLARTYEWLLDNSERDLVKRNCERSFKKGDIVIHFVD